MIVVNFKTYSEASGRKAIEIAEVCKKAASETGEKVIVTPQPQDLVRIEDIEKFSQHVDPVEPGSHTGHILPENLEDANASGTLINHSERRIETEKIEKAIERCKKLGLTTIVCAQSPKECGELSELEPDFIAYEPPELIGGDRSVSEAKPGLIEEAVKRSEVDLLTGAGIHSAKDVEKSIELGCKGVLVASGVVKDENPYKAVKELCRGLQGLEEKPHREVSAGGGSE